MLVELGRVNQVGEHDTKFFLSGTFALFHRLIGWRHANPYCLSLPNTFFLVGNQYSKERPPVKSEASVARAMLLLGVPLDRSLVFQKPFPSGNRVDCNLVFLEFLFLIQSDDQVFFDSVKIS